jgi:hypothetical protein
MPTFGLQGGLAQSRPAIYDGDSNALGDYRRLTRT